MSAKLNIEPRETAFDRRRRGGGAVGDAELGKDVFNVSFDGIFRNVEFIGNFLVRISFDYHCQNFAFGRRELFLT